MGPESWSPATTAHFALDNPPTRAGMGGQSGGDKTQGRKMNALKIGTMVRLKI